jgi:hypothetical protein
MNLVFKYEAAPKGSKFSKVVEDTRQRDRDNATLRLARIVNGAEPGYVKGGRQAGK